MAIRCNTLDELVLSVCQLANTGNEYFVHVYRTTRNRQFKGVVRGTRPVGSTHLSFSVGPCSSSSPRLYDTLSIRRIHATGEARFILRRMIRLDGWTRVGHERV